MKPPLPPSQFWLEIINVPVTADMIDVYDEFVFSSVCRVCVCGLYAYSSHSFVQCICLHMRLLVFLQLGDYISDIASNMMLVEEHILWMAQNEARACTRIVQCVERIADLSLTGDNQVISKVRLDFETVAPTLTAAQSRQRLII